MVAGVAGTVGGSGIERIKGTDKEGLLDVNRIDRYDDGVLHTWKLSLGDR